LCEADHDAGPPAYYLDNDLIDLGYIMAAGAGALGVDFEDELRPFHDALTFVVAVLIESGEYTG
jgi:hypothetical protein